MPEIRIDPLTGLKVVIAPERAERPGALPAVAPPPAVDPAGDPFAPGNEAMTPPEIARRTGGDGGWSVRVVPNRYPAWDAAAAETEPDAREDLFSRAPARGAHEVIVNAPGPVSTLADLDAAQLALAVDVWRERMAAHADAACRHLHVNEGEAGGASLPHTHAQLSALPFVPAAIARERERYGAYAVQTMGGDLMSDLLGEEVRRRERIVAIDDEAVLLAPWASRVPYQLMLVPRRSRPRFEDAPVTGAALLHDGLRRLRARFGASPPLTLWIRTAPAGADRFCWRMDILPRLVPLAGLELGTGVHLCVVAPETAAGELRAAA